MQVAGIVEDTTARAIIHAEIAEALTTAHHLEDAQRALGESLSLIESLDGHARAWCLTRIARVLAQQGRTDEARMKLDAALRAGYSELNGSGEAFLLDTWLMLLPEHASAFARVWSRFERDAALRIRALLRTAAATGNWRSLRVLLPLASTDLPAAWTACAAIIEMFPEQTAATVSRLHAVLLPLQSRGIDEVR
jgi:hypothetical protein